MTQVIVFANAKGAVSVCYPTGEMPIEYVKTRDCPSDAIIVDVNDLPNDQRNFFDAWRLVDGKVIVDADAVNAIKAQREALAALYNKKG